MKTLDWYFDFLSPYAYLQNALSAPIAARAQVRRRPVLLGGLLTHHGTLGPAEVPAKRTWTYRHVTWLASHHGVPLVVPTTHPFNPLPLLRLALAASGAATVEPAVVDRLFAYVWREGRTPDDEPAWRALIAEIGADEAALGAPRVKEALRRNGTDAIAAGVFGVPTTVVDGHVFFGLDATGMVLDYLDDPESFDDAAMRAASAPRPALLRTRVAGVAVGTTP